MSPVRIVTLLSLALMLVGLLAVNSADRHAHAWLVGQRLPAPALMIRHQAGPRLSGRLYDI